MSARLKELAGYMLDAYRKWNDNDEGGEDDLHYAAKVLREELVDTDTPSAPAVIELTNIWLGGVNTYIFHQAEGDALLNATLINKRDAETLGIFLTREMIDELDNCTMGSRVDELLRRTLAAERIEDLLKWASRLYMRDMPRAEPSNTTHGEWFYNRYEITK